MLKISGCKLSCAQESNGRSMLGSSFDHALVGCFSNMVIGGSGRIDAPIKVSFFDFAQ
jgi:hypothetical protein